MSEKGRIIWLTVLQGIMVFVGLGVLTAVKLLYQRLVIVTSFRETLRSQILGEESPSPMSGFTLSLMALPLVLIVGRNASSIFFRAGRKKRQIKRDIKAMLLLESLHQGRKETF